MATTTIHPTAIIEPGASLDEGVTVGAFCYVGDGVRLGAGTELRHHSTVEGNTEMARDNVVYPYACIGGKTQDLKFKGGNPGVKIGDRNVFRECCTVHAATFDGNFTQIGNDNNFLAYTHVAHDCIVGNHVIMSNNGTLAGHVVVQDHAIVGGLTAIHQFCRIGRFAMLGGCSKVVQDVPPYMIADGNPVQIRSINKVGLERHGHGDTEIRLVRQAFKILYREGLNHGQAANRLRELEDSNGIIASLLDFMAKSERGLA